MIRRYEELRPDELSSALAETPLFICPWGALEWHGPHLPLGLDGILANTFSERLADATGGVLLPATWLPITTLPHATSISLPATLVTAVWSALFDELARVGAKTICLVSGHYAQGHELEMYKACSGAMFRHPGLRVIASSPLEMMADDAMLDHAGHFETSQLMACRPDLVRLDLFTEGTPAVNAVLGRNPRDASAEIGEKLLADALEAWRQALQLWDPPVIHYFYSKRERVYRQYKQEYFRESWEQAIRDWWAVRSSHIG